MSLEKLKELEDAKAEANRFGEQLSQLIEKRKAELYDRARREFEAYFKENGFTVNTTPNQFNASYGSIKVQVILPDVNTPYIGAYSVWDLSYNDKKFIVPLNELGRYPGVVTSFISSSPKNEAERIQREIDQAKQRSNELAKKIEEFPSVKWGYGLKMESQKGLDKYPQFESFAELLAELFR